MEVLLVAALVIAVIGVGLILYRATAGGNACGVEIDRTEVDADNGGLGAPVFNSVEGTTKPAPSRIEMNSMVTVLSPVGAQSMRVEAIVTEGNVRSLDLQSQDFRAIAEWDGEYFSETVAAKLGVDRGVWRLKKFWEKLDQTQAAIPYTVTARQSNNLWAQTELSFEDDIIDWVLIYYFLFDGFDQPYEHYEGLEPVYDGDWVSNVETQEEVAARTAEEFDRQRAEADAYRQEQERIEQEQAAQESATEFPETKSSSFESVEETTRTSAFDSGSSSYDSYDSGSSYDSGDSGGDFGD